MSKVEGLTKTLANFVAALTNCSLYSADHIAVDEFSKKTIASMDDLFTDGLLSFAFFAETLLFNDVPVSEKVPHIMTLMKKLRLKGVDRLVFKKGVTTDELKRLIVDLTSQDVELSSSDNIIVGTFDIKLKTDVELQNRILKLAKLFGDMSDESDFSMFELDRMVEGFMVALREETNFLKLLEPLASFSEYTYVHSINVSLVTLGLAEALGLRGENLHDAGIAGLLHDVGKLYIKQNVVEKETGLTPRDWELMKLHPIKGALFLSKVPEIPKVAAVVAFEHHMRHDGKGYPVRKRIGTGQSRVSGIVAIADFFDAMRSIRKYRQNQQFYTQEVTALIKQGRGTYFHPDLVDTCVPVLESL